MYKENGNLDLYFVNFDVCYLSSSIHEKKYSTNFSLSVIDSVTNFPICLIIRGFSFDSMKMNF